MKRGIGILMVLVLGIGLVSPVAGAGSRDSVAVTRSEFLPATLERDLDGVKKSLVGLNGKDSFAMEIVTALDQWMGSVDVAKARAEKEPTAGNREALLRVVEQALGDLAARLESAASLPGQQLITGFADAHRRLAAVTATVKAKKEDVENLAADGDTVVDLERRARKAVQTFVSGGKRNQRLKSEIRRLRVQLSLAPLRERTRKAQASLLAKLGGQLELFANHARNMSEYIEASVVAMKELASIYGELRTTVGYYRVAQAAIRDIASSGVADVMAQLAVIRDKQAGILNAFAVVSDLAGSFDEYDGAVRKQQKALAEARKVGGEGDIEDMIRRYGDSRATE